MTFANVSLGFGKTWDRYSERKSRFLVKREINIANVRLEVEICELKFCMVYILRHDFLARCIEPPLHWNAAAASMPGPSPPERKGIAGVGIGILYQNTLILAV